MKKIAIYILGSLLLITCKKNNVTSNSASNAKLVKSITHKIHKVDSSGNFHITVDSFLYDNQNRVSTYFNIAYDTSFLLDTGGHKVITSSSITNSYSLNYSGSSLIPNSTVESGGTSYIGLNNTNQIISDSVSPANPITHYTYFDGLIVGITLFPQSTSYTMDSITIDANNNMTSFILGGNYFLNSSNQFTYGRGVLGNYSYSDIANPIYANKSAATILFLYNGIIQSKNIIAGSEWINYDLNFAIVRDEVSTFQNTVDANNLIQSSLNLKYGDLTTWSYY